MYKQEDQKLRRLTFNCIIQTILLVMSLKYTPVAQNVLCLIFLMNVGTIKRLNYGGQESKKQFTVCNSDTPVTLKQGQRHAAWYALVDPQARL